MTRYDPVGITIQKSGNQIVFVPDPAGLIQTNGTIFFSNGTALQLEITIFGKTVPLGPNAQSDGLLVAANGPQELNCLNHRAVAYTLQISDQFTLIQPPSGGPGATFLPLQLSAGNWMLWQNNDTQAHQPTPNDGTAWTANPPSIAPYSWSQMVQFPTAGNFPYHCAAHPRETGTITVIAS